MIKELEMGELSWIIWWAQGNDRGPLGIVRGREVIVREDVIMEAESERERSVEDATLLALSMKAGAISQACRWTLEFGKAKC